MTLVNNEVKSTLRERTYFKSTIDHAYTIRTFLLSTCVLIVAPNRPLSLLLEWTRLPQEHSGSTRHARRNWRFYLRFAVCHENACADDADFAFGTIVDSLETEPLPPPSRPPSTSSHDAAAPGVSAISAGLPSAERLCEKLLSAFKS